MTTTETIHYARGALMHYELELNEHAMSEDAESSIRKQLNELWDYMFYGRCSSPYYGVSIINPNNRLPSKRKR